jgi:hypothetical protein
MSWLAPLRRAVVLESHGMKHCGVCVQEQGKQLREVDRSIEALQEVEPLKRLEGSINRTMIWQHVRPHVHPAHARCGMRMSAV